LIEPEHRLVARQLAKDWEDALLAQRQLHENYARFVQAQPQPLTTFPRCGMRPPRPGRSAKRLSGRSSSGSSSLVKGGVSGARSLSNGLGVGAPRGGPHAPLATSRT
jgi:hypothetical protein